jgi:hypothetical protein
VEKIDEINQRLIRVEQVQSSHTEMIGSLLESVETLKSELKGL